MLQELGHGRLIVDFYRRQLERAVGLNEIQMVANAASSHESGLVGCGSDEARAAG